MRKADVPPAADPLEHVSLPGATTYNPSSTHHHSVHIKGISLRLPVFKLYLLQSPSIAQDKKIIVVKVRFRPEKPRHGTRLPTGYIMPQKRQQIFQHSRKTNSLPFHVLQQLVKSLQLLKLQSEESFTGETDVNILKSFNK